MLFSFSQFGAASLRRSKPTFSREGYILFSSYQMFDALKQNLVVKQIFFSCWLCTFVFERLFLAYSLRSPNPINLIIGFSRKTQIRPLHSLLVLWLYRCSSKDYIYFIWDHSNVALQGVRLTHIYLNLNKWGDCLYPPTSSQLLLLTVVKQTQEKPA